MLKQKMKFGSNLLWYNYSMTTIYMESTELINIMITLTIRLLPARIVLAVLNIYHPSLFHLGARLV